MPPAGAFVAVVVTSSERLAEIQARRETLVDGPQRRDIDWLLAEVAAAEARVETLQQQVEQDRMRFARETRITSAAFNTAQHRSLKAPRGIVGEALAGWDDAMRVVERCMRLACDEGYGFIETDVSRAIEHEKSLGYTSVDGRCAARIALAAVPGKPQPTEER